MRRNSIATLIIVSVLLGSCSKKVGGTPPPSARLTILIGYTWKIKSANSIDSLSTGSLHRYQGTNADTLNFFWSLGNSVTIYAVESMMNGVTTQAGIQRVTPAANISIADTSTIAYDTIFCNTQFRPNYSDTVFITKVSSQVFVFKIRYSDVNGKGIEIDTLSRFRDH